VKSENLIKERGIVFMSDLKKTMKKERKKTIITIIAVLPIAVGLVILGLFIYLKLTTNIEISFANPKEIMEYNQKSALYTNISCQDTLNSKVVEFVSDTAMKRIIETANDEKTIIVFFTALGCTGCDEQYPYFKKVAKEFEEKHLFLMNKCQMGNQKFQRERYIMIDVFPTIIVFKDGKECKRFSDPIEMEDWLKAKGEQY
jgi:thiol-disulfide isomerase/thioredoxin